VLIDAIRSCSLPVEIEVDFVYSLANYNPPPEVAPLNSHVGAVLAAFAGWTSEPDRGAVAIVGLGYEEDKALGAVEHVQAAETWILIPTSPVAEYTPALRAANKTLLDVVPRDHQIQYSVSTPLDLFIMLESLVYRLSQSRNPILLPFGPKLFAVCALLVACIYQDTAVWRVSAEGFDTPMDRTSSPHIFGVKAIFPYIGPPEHSERSLASLPE
jgi:hypothetical protein